MVYKEDFRIDPVRNSVKWVLILRKEDF